MSSNVLPFPLGRNHVPDVRDLNYPMKAALPRRAVKWRERPWLLGPVYDQSSYVCPQCEAREYPHAPHCCELGYCVEYAWTSYLEAQPIRTKAPYPRLQMYHEFQKIDQWPGLEYAGTSVRAGVEWLRSKGHIAQYVWSFDAATVAEFVRTRGTVVVGTDWRENMFWPDKSTGYVLNCGGRVVGGHAYHIVWFYKRVTLADGKTYRNVFVKKGSWGDWGDRGFAYIRFEDMDRLIKADGEAVAAIERKVI